MDSSVNAHPRDPAPRRSRTRFRLTIAVFLGIGVMYMFGRALPQNLGVRDGQLAPCPDRPNCVSTQAKNEQHRIAPLLMTGDLEAVTTVARRAILEIPRSRFVTQNRNYCHVECTSRICRFVDDFEVWIDEESKLIHVRSASQFGYSDMGVNRTRVEQFFEKLVAGGVARRK